MDVQLIAALLLCIGAVVLWFAKETLENRLTVRASGSFDPRLFLLKCAALVVGSFGFVLAGESSTPHSTFEAWSMCVLTALLASVFCAAVRSRQMSRQ